jgi:hypothetical protein
MSWPCQMPLSDQFHRIPSAVRCHAGSPSRTLVRTQLQLLQQLTCCPTSSASSSADVLPFPTFTKGLWQVLREEMAARTAAGGGPASPFATAPAVAPALTASIFPRLGCLFLDFKGKPLLCAAYFGVKLAKNVAKGALVGVFYGEAAAWLTRVMAGRCQQQWQWLWLQLVVLPASW